MDARLQNALDRFSRLIGGRVSVVREVVKKGDRTQKVRYAIYLTDSDGEPQTDGGPVAILLTADNPEDTYVLLDNE